MKRWIVYNQLPVWLVVEGISYIIYRPDRLDNFFFVWIILSMMLLIERLTRQMTHGLPYDGSSFAGGGCMTGSVSVLGLVETGGWMRLHEDARVRAIPLSKIGLFLLNYTFFQMII